MVFKCFDEVDKTAWLYFLFAGIKPDFVDFSTLLWCCQQESTLLK